MDDFRDSPAILVIKKVQNRGTDVVTYDTVATREMRTQLTYVGSAASLKDAHDVIVVTDWDEFGALDSEFEAMADPVFVDGQNFVERRTGIQYEGLTW